MNTHFNTQRSENYSLLPAVDTAVGTKRTLNSESEKEQPHQIRRGDLGLLNPPNRPFARSDIRSFFTTTKKAAISTPSSTSDGSSPNTTSAEKDSEERSSSSRDTAESSSHSASGTQCNSSSSNSSTTEREIVADEDSYDSDKTILVESYAGTIEVTDTAPEDFFSELAPRASVLEPAIPFVSPWPIDHEAGALPLEIKEIPSTIAPDDYLKQKGINIERLSCGHGSCGKVYNAMIAGNSTPFLYKVEINPKSLGEKPHRHNDLASGRLDDLPHIVKPLFVILQLKTALNAPLRSFYIPLNKAKEFSSTLPPGSQVRILSQIVPKAPGKNLEQLLSSNEINFDPQGPHFRAVLLGICKFLKTAYPHNFIHRDLKPENIMYDPITKTVTIIDMGLSLRLRRREKTEPLKGVSNPISSKQLLGTPDYMSPFVLQENSYGSEIDFHSTAMILLSLISHKDFEAVSQCCSITRSDGKLVNTLFQYLPPPRFLPDYLTLLGPQSITATTLAANPDIREIIDLAFQISAGGEAGQAALAAFEKLPYFTVH